MPVNCLFNAYKGYKRSLELKFGKTERRMWRETEAKDLYNLVH